MSSSASCRTEEIRNIALVGHTGSGKTSLVERLLERTGAIGAGNHGGSACDFEPEERQHGHSLNSAIVSTRHEGAQLNLIDTPGMPDFIGPAVAALPAVETVAVTVNAQAGIEMTARRMMEWAERRGLCRMIVINKIDAENIDLPALVEQIRQTFGAVCLPINLPADGGRDVVDVFDHSSGASDFSSVAEAHTRIVDQVVEVDEELMARYLEQGEVRPEQLHEPFEKALRDGHLVPICFASASTGAGLDDLLHIFARQMPNPTEGNPHPFEQGEGDDAEPLAYAHDPDGHVIGHVFKVTSDPFVGKLSVFRIHQGTVTPDSQLYIGDARKPFRVGHLFRLQGKERLEAERGIPGDIRAVAKVEDIHFNDVLHDSPADGRVHLKPIRFPAPMEGIAVEPAQRGDEQKLARALTGLQEEDPCLKVERADESKETVIRGLGQMHLRVALEKIRHRHGVEVETHPPRIAYHETVTKTAEAQHRHKKQTGGAGEFAEVHLRLEPLERGAGFEFVDAIVGGVIPNQFIPAVEKGVRRALAEGCVAGYPMQDVRVTVFDGKHHPVDSKEVAFVTAARKAFAEAARNAGPVVLEPMVDMQISAPEETMGDVAGDLSGRRGRMQGTETLPGGMLLIRAQAPLAELNNYQSRLKSITGGRASFTMAFSHYEPVPAHVQQQLAEAQQPHATAQ